MDTIDIEIERHKEQLETAFLRWRVATDRKVQAEQAWNDAEHDYGVAERSLNRAIARKEQLDASTSPAPTPH